LEWIVNITVPTNIPSGDRRTTRVALATAPAALVLQDRDGEVWRQAGVTASGEPLMVCDAPQAPEDRGNGLSYPWTPDAIRVWFSPVRILGGAA
jgi:hypothetical protein